MTFIRCRGRDWEDKEEEQKHDINGISQKNNWQSMCAVLGCCSRPSTFYLWQDIDNEIEGRMEDESRWEWAIKFIV